MAKSRIRKIRTNTNPNLQQAETDVFFMSLEEAKEAIASKYEFLADRYERQYPEKPNKGLS